MDELICKRCKTKSNSKFCPNCGEKIISQPKTAEEIRKMLDLIDKAGDVKKKDRGMGMLDLVLVMAVNVALCWSLGEGSINPIEMILTESKSKDNENNKEIESIIELSKLI